MGRRPTVYDVAARAGVSTATVSFSFSQPDRVKQSTRELVLATAAAIGYVPSASARGLATGSAGALGLYSFDYQLDTSAEETDLRHFPMYVDEVQRGVQLECRRRGYALMLGAGHKEGQLPAVIDIAGRVDGLIAFAGSAPAEAIIQASKRIPVVELGSSIAGEDVHTVPVDNRTGMTELTAHLLRTHGFRRFVYLGTTTLPEFTSRYDGFAAALTGAGRPVPDPVLSHPGDDASTNSSVERCLDDLPDVFVCSTDQEALVAIDTLVAAGIDVPGDVAVTGFDGTLAGRFATPRLTTVRQPMEQIGRIAVQILTGLLNDSPAELTGPLPAPFVLGESCGC
ncbi:LacI family DNA-binding transcriptional regulator [Kribbella sp. NPDC049174]|uniref:LacI family DNA-binding transcriptional regulator n=1 Tax=Kribbella sp. NPDC049174 TaxID=3364112 RepID=UPI00371E3D22